SWPKPAPTPAPDDRRRLAELRRAARRQRLWKSGLMLGRLGVMAAGGAAGFGLLAAGKLTIDTGVGRRLRPLGPLTVTMAAAPETVFDVIAARYLGRTPRALRAEVEVLERGTDMVVAAHHTRVGGGLTATTVESVRFERPRAVTFRLLRGPVPHVTERFALN